tara:strand:- start:15862 stop:16293 length:432 start_codon:yes stop_codon:yes gene_type:complete
MKTIIINTKSKPRRRSKKNSKIPKTQKSLNPLNITKMDYQNGMFAPYISKEELIKEYVNNNPEIKTIKLTNSVKSKPHKKGKFKLSTQNPPKNITHTVNNTKGDNKIKHLKNNQNIKYFKNFPNSRDMIVCSILSQNFNIIKY